MRCVGRRCRPGERPASGVLNRRLPDARYRIGTSPSRHPAPLFLHIRTVSKARGESLNILSSAMLRMALPMKPPAIEKAS